MAVDPNLTGDTAIHSEDGATPWLSPDIELNPTTTPGVANPGQANDLRVRGRRRAAWAGGSTRAKYEVWVCIPSPTLAPNVGSTRVGSGLGSASGPLQAGFPSEEWKSFTWTPPSGIPTGEPESP